MPVALPSTSLTQKQAVENPGALKTRAGTGFYELLSLHVSPSISNDGHLQAELGVGGGGGGGWRAGGEAISSMFIGEFVRDFIHQCLKKQHALDKSELYDLHALEGILAHSPKKIMPVHSYRACFESHPSAFFFLQPPLHLRNQHSE